MQDRTCPICQTQHQRRGIYCGSRCKKRAENAKCAGWDPTSRPMPAPYDCAQCGTRCTPGGDVVAHASRFCGATCKKRWHKKREIYRPPLAQWPPTVGAWDVSRYKRILRADPCAYCGTTTGGIDHIEPSSRRGTDEWTNYTGCCQRCNAIKQAAPLLLALLWVPISREYHDLRRLLWAAA